jgi:CubicO group peptidase (beta-lactamase class C family)
VGTTPADGAVHTVRAQSAIDASVEQIDLLARDLMERSGILGMALAIVHDDQMVFAKGYGAT